MEGNLANCPAIHKPKSSKHARKLSAKYTAARTLAVTLPHLRQNVVILQLQQNRTAGACGSHTMEVRLRIGAGQLIPGECFVRLCTVG